MPAPPRQRKVTPNVPEESEATPALTRRQLFVSGAGIAAFAGAGLLLGTGAIAGRPLFSLDDDQAGEHRSGAAPAAIKPTAPVFSDVAAIDPWTCLLFLAGKLDNYPG